METKIVKLNNGESVKVVQVGQVIACSLVLPDEPTKKKRK